MFVCAVILLNPVNSGGAFLVALIPHFVLPLKKLCVGFVYCLFPSPTGNTTNKGTFNCVLELTLI